MFENRTSQSETPPPQMGNDPLRATTKKVHSPRYLVNTLKHYYNPSKGSFKKTLLILSPSKCHLGHIWCHFYLKVSAGTTAEQAPRYILGYTAANDVSAHNVQMKPPLYCFSKGMGSSCPLGKSKVLKNWKIVGKSNISTLLGPVLVSAAVIPDPQNLKINATSSSKTVQEGHTSDRTFRACEPIAYLSQGTTTEPGTIILTGTPPGIGYFRSPRIFLGDTEFLLTELGPLSTRFTMSNLQI